MKLPYQFRSVRASLIAFTLVVFSLLLAVLGFICVVSSRQAVMNSIDGDLRSRGDDFARMISTRRGPGGRPPAPPVPFLALEPPRRQGPRHVKDPQGIAPDAIPIPGADPQRGPENVDPKALAYDYDAYLQAAKGHTLLTTINVGGEMRRVYSTPARRDGKVREVVQLSASLSNAMGALDSLRLTMLRVVLPLGLLLVGAASLFVVERLLKPLRRITSESKRIGDEGFGERLVPVGNDEFASLVGTLNGMLGGLEDVYRKEQETNRSLAQSLERQHQFTSDASHELKTPLSVIKAYIGLLRHSPGLSEDGQAAVEEMNRAANRMNGLIQDLLLLAKNDGPSSVSRKECSISIILREAVESVPNAGERITLQAGAATVSASTEELTRVFVNLIENAMKHSGS